MWTWRGLVTFYTVFVIGMASRRVQILGSTPHPDEAFMGQIVRTVTMADSGMCRVLICDRGAKWTVHIFFCRLPCRLGRTTGTGRVLPQHRDARTPAGFRKRTQRGCRRTNTCPLSHMMDKQPSSPSLRMEEHFERSSPRTLSASSRSPRRVTANWSSRGECARPM
jgi:hypothetical protein